MNRKKENSKYNPDTEKKLKTFLFELNNKKEIIKSFKKRHINHIKKNKETKSEIIYLKIYSLQNFIKEFEKLVQLSLEFIIFVQETLKHNLIHKKLNSDNNEFLFNDGPYILKNYNITNLEVADKFNQTINSSIDNNNNINSEKTFAQKKFCRDSSHNNLRNYYFFQNLPNKDLYNNYKYSTCNDDYMNCFPSLKEKTFRTLYNQNNFIFNNSKEVNNIVKEINNRSLKIPIRKSLRALIKEKK